MNFADARTLEVRTRGMTLARAVVLAAGFAGALAVAAQVRIPLPFTPVPITLQTLVLYLGAVWLGGRVAVGGLALYIGSALAGIPVMSGFRGGVGAFAGATGGYVLGWVVAVMLVSLVLHRKAHSWARTFGAMALGSAVILTFGALHLGLLLDLSPAQAFVMGVAPFIPGDTLKILTAAALARRWPNPIAEN